MKLKRSYKQLFYVALLIFVLKKTYYGSKERNVKKKDHEKSEKLSLLDQPVNQTFNKQELYAIKADYI